jgi:hypothetical protein
VEVNDGYSSMPETFRTSIQLQYFLPLLWLSWKHMMATVFLGDDNEQNITADE